MNSVPIHRGASFILTLLLWFSGVSTHSFLEQALCLQEHSLQFENFSHHCHTTLSFINRNQQHITVSATNDDEVVVRLLHNNFSFYKKAYIAQAAATLYFCAGQHYRSLDSLLSPTSEKTTGVCIGNNFYSIFVPLVFSPENNIYKLDTSRPPLINHAYWQTAEEHAPLSPSFHHPSFAQVQKNVMDAYHSLQYKPSLPHDDTDKEVREVLSFLSTYLTEIPPEQWWLTRTCLSSSGLLNCQAICSDRTEENTVRELTAMIGQLRINCPVTEKNLKMLCTTYHSLFGKEKYFYYYS